MIDRLLSLFLALLLLSATPLAKGANCPVIMSDFEQIRNNSPAIQISVANYTDYHNAVQINGIPIGQFGDNQLTDFLSQLDMCTQELRLERTRIEGNLFQFSQEEKRGFVNAVARLQNPFLFLNEFNIETVFPGGVMLSCRGMIDADLSAIHTTTPKQILFGKRWGDYSHSDLADISKKLNQCMELLDKPWADFTVDQRWFKSALKRTMNFITKLESELNWLSETRRQEQLAREKRESFSYKASQWISSAFDWIGKAIAGIGFVLLIIASFGVAKRDKRFKTGRVNNQSDAPWVAPISIIGFVALVIGGLLVWIAGKA